MVKRCFTSYIFLLTFHHAIFGFGESASRPGGFCCAARTYSRSQTVAVNAPKATSWMKPHQEITEDRLHVKVGCGDFLRCCSCCCDPQLLRKNWWGKKGRWCEQCLLVFSSYVFGFSAAVRLLILSSQVALGRGSQPRWLEKHFDYSRGFRMFVTYISRIRVEVDHIFRTGFLVLQSQNMLVRVCYGWSNGWHPYRSCQI